MRGECFDGRQRPGEDRRWCRVICPHCTSNVLRRERTERRCGKCRKRFALEPQETPLRLHDRRVRRLAEVLGDGGQLSYTPEQFWYAAARGRLDPPGAWLFPCFMALMVPLVGAVVVLCVVLEPSLEGVLMMVVTGALIGVLISVVLWRVGRRERRDDPIRVPADQATLQSDLREHWPAVYKSMPQGMVDGDLPAEQWGGSTPQAAAVLCPDSAVLVCLAANDLPQRLGAWLYTAPEQVPQGVPTVVLHDASPQGVLFAARARQVLGAHASVVGLAPRTVLPARDEKGRTVTNVPDMDEDTGPAKGLRLRESRLSPQEVDQLRQAEPRLTEEELSWLAEGWWFPLAGVRPRALLTVVEAAVRRAQERGDPERHAARAIGFMTPPDAASGPTDAASGPTDPRQPWAERP